MENSGLRWSTGEVQRNRDFSEKSPGVNAACGATTTGVDRNFEGKFFGEYGFSGEPVKISLTEMKRSGNWLDL
jgi:hypothetical protein